MSLNRIVSRRFCLVGTQDLPVPVVADALLMAVALPLGGMVLLPLGAPPAAHVAGISVSTSTSAVSQICVAAWMVASISA